MKTLTARKFSALATLITILSVAANVTFASPPAAARSARHVTVLAPVVVTGTRITASEKVRLAQAERNERAIVTTHSAHKS